MRDNYQRKGWVYILIPLLLYWIVNMIAVAAAEAAVMLNYAVKHVSDKTEPGAVWEYITRNYDKLYDLGGARLVELTTVGAVATLILALVIIQKDKKRVLLIQNQRGNPGEKSQKADDKADKPPIWRYASLLLFGFAVCVVLNNLCNMVGLAFYSAAYQETAEAMYSASFVVQIICLGVVIPISEEFIFRGVIFRRLRRMGGFTFAMLYSTALFALMHGNMVQLFYAFGLGVFLAYVYEKFCSLAAPVILHIAVNLTSLILTKMGAFEWMFVSPLRLGLATIGSTFIAACVFAVFRQMKGQLEEDRR